MDFEGWHLAHGKSQKGMNETLEQSRWSQTPQSLFQHARSKMKVRGNDKMKSLFSSLNKLVWTRRARFEAPRCRHLGSENNSMSARNSVDFPDPRVETFPQFVQGRFSLRNPEHLRWDSPCRTPFSQKHSFFRKFAVALATSPLYLRKLLCIFLYTVVPRNSNLALTTNYKKM